MAVLATLTKSVAWCLDAIIDKCNIVATDASLLRPRHMCSDHKQTKMPWKTRGVTW